jgi:hypothetical protein
MGDVKLSSEACRRGRELASLELDDELSQLDRVRLSLHVSRCGSCRDFRRRVHATTRLLRAAPLERPSRQIMLPRRRRLTLRSMRVSSAAAALVVAAGVAAFLPLRTHPQKPGVRPVLGGSQQSELRVLRNVRLDRIKPEPVGLAGGVQ